MHGHALVAMPVLAGVKLPCSFTVISDMTVHKWYI